MRSPSPCRSLRFAVLGLAAGLCAAGLAVGCGAEGSTGPRRLVLVTLDTLRKDALTAETMPRVAALADTGLRFERFYAAAPTTQPTHASLFTGLHPWQHGITRNGMVLPEEHPTLAEVLAAEGWDTAAAVSSYPVHRKFGYGRGFRSFHDTFTFERKKMPEKWLGQETVGDHFFSLSESTTDEALALLDGLRGPRQFLWVHYFDAHSPYGDLAEQPVTLRQLRSLAREDDLMRLEESAARARSLYATDVARLDGEVARFLERVLADAQEIETHVLVTVDHGESFGEEDAWGHDVRVTPEQIHVPTFLLSPRVSAGATEDVAGTVDAYATLLALAGIEGLGGGRDLTRAAPAGAAASGMRHREGEAEPYRFFHASADGLVAGTADVLRHDDVLGAELPQGAREDLRTLFGLFEAELTRGERPERVEDEETLQALEALGYTGE